MLKAKCNSFPDPHQALPKRYCLSINKKYFKKPLKFPRSSPPQRYKRLTIPQVAMKKLFYYPIVLNIKCCQQCPYTCFQHWRLWPFNRIIIKRFWMVTVYHMADKTLNCYPLQQTVARLQKSYKIIVHSGKWFGIYIVNLVIILIIIL